MPFTRLVKDQEFYDNIFYYKITMTFFGIVGAVLVIVLIWG